MLPSGEALSKLIGQLYDAAADPLKWDTFLENLAQNVRATSAGLVMLDVGRDLFTLSRTWEVDPEATRLYQEHYGPLDIWAKRGLAKPAGYVCSSEALCPLSELAPTEVYNEFMIPFGIEHGLFGVAENSGSRWASISLYRNASCPAFGTSESDIVRILAPHMQRAFGLHMQLSELKAQSVGLETAMNMLPTGMVFFGANGKVIHLNPSASAFVAEKDGLLGTHQELRAERAAESSLLEKTIRHTASAINGKSVSAGGSIMISRRSRPPLRIQVSPINTPLAFASEAVTAVAFIVDPSRRQRPPRELLRMAYGMTPAECRVALLLSDGRAPRDIAEMLGVTVNTVRSQVKSIFAKTNVRRQGELIRLLLDSAGSAADPSPRSKRAQ
jgi:DNA-binding CsgD family transcriptional regulator